MIVCKEYTNIRWTNIKPKKEFISFVQSCESWEPGDYMFIQTSKVNEARRILKILKNGK